MGSAFYFPRFSLAPRRINLSKTISLEMVALSTEKKPLKDHTVMVRIPETTYQAYKKFSLLKQIGVSTLIRDHLMQIENSGILKCRQPPK